MHSPGSQTVNKPPDRFGAVRPLVQGKDDDRRRKRRQNDPNPGQSIEHNV